MYITKKTYISGYITLEGRPAPNDIYQAFKEWHHKNYKVYSLHGFWKLDNAIKYAEKHGLTLNISITHEQRAEKAWACGINNKWVLLKINDMPNKVQ